MSVIEVRDWPDRSRFELTVDGEYVGHLQYRRDRHVYTLPHTEVDPAYNGRGLGRRLVADALDDLRGRGVQVLPDCPFVARFIREHPDYLDLVPADQHGRYGLTG